jgi:hypothetical protein
LKIVKYLSNNKMFATKGLARIMFAALLSNNYSNVSRLANLPYLGPIILFGLLTHVAWLFGYGSTYRKYQK